MLGSISIPDHRISAFDSDHHDGDRVKPGAAADASASDDARHLIGEEP
jgi:hypothetical protein